VYLTKKVNEFEEIKSVSDQTGIDSNDNILQKELENLQAQLKIKNLELLNLLKSYEGEKIENKNVIKKYTTEIEDFNKKIKYSEEKTLELQQQNLNLIKEKTLLEEKCLIDQIHKVDSEEFIKNLQNELGKEKDNFLILNKKYEKLIVDLSRLETSCKVLKDLEQKNFRFTTHK